MQKFIAVIIFGAGLLLSASTLFSLASRDKQNSADSQGLSSISEKLDNKLANLENTFKNLLDKSKSDEDTIKLAGEEQDQINFLFLGIGGEEHISGNYLTDTNILFIFIPSSKKAAAISIPRDLLVKHPIQDKFTRLNALYAIKDPDSGEPHEFPGPMGIKYVNDAIKNITGVNIDYYAVLDLAGVEKVVDVLGGINIQRSDDLEDKTFPDDNYGYETYGVNEGWRYLNGEQAVKYIRTRHTSGGDFDRMKRQQEVARAIKKKIEGLQSVSGLPKLFSIYSALQDHFTTNLSFSEIMRLMKIGENTKTDNIVFDSITAQPGGLLVYDKIVWNGVQASVLSPRAGRENFQDIIEKINNTIINLKNAE